MRSLVLGLGNELIADDGIGILAARNLKPQIHKEADVIESSLSGLALLDLLVGYDRAIIIDAIYSGNHPPGTITQLNMDDLSRVVAPTPHFAGLPELFALAQRLELDFPEELVIFAVEAEDPLTIGGSLSPAVEQALPDLIDQTINRVSQWKEKHTS
jgi:hydrogenase maturation protease